MTATQFIESTPIAEGQTWRLVRIEVRRDPILGAVLRTGQARQIRIVESGGLVVGTDSDLKILGPGHRIDVDRD